MAYNLTALDAANTTMGIVQEVNTLTDDWAARLFLIGLFGLILISISIKSGETLKAMVAAGFITTLVSFLFLAADLVSNAEPLMCLIGTAAAIATLYMGGVAK